MYKHSNGGVRCGAGGGWQWLRVLFSKVEIHHWCSAGGHIWDEIL